MTLSALLLNNVSTPAICSSNSPLALTLSFTIPTNTVVTAEAAAVIDASPIFAIFPSLLIPLEKPLHLILYQSLHFHQPRIFLLPYNFFTRMQQQILFPFALEFSYLVMHKFFLIFYILVFHLYP